MQTDNLPISLTCYGDCGKSRYLIIKRPKKKIENHPKIEIYLKQSHWYHTFMYGLEDFKDKYIIEKCDVLDDEELFIDIIYRYDNGSFDQVVSYYVTADNVSKIRSMLFDMSAPKLDKAFYLLSGEKQIEDNTQLKTLIINQPKLDETNVDLVEIYIRQGKWYHTFTYDPNKFSGSYIADLCKLNCTGDIIIDVVYRYDHAPLKNGCDTKHISQYYVHGEKINQISAMMIDMKTISTPTINDSFWVLNKDKHLTHDGFECFPIFADYKSN